MVSASRKGFSLVELSVVLIILGLLVGGILAGRGLIRNAELANVLTEYESFKSAIAAFEQKYNGLPGDVTNASDYWGAASNCNWASGPISSGTATCDGDGDQRIGGLNSTRQWEYTTFWQHLSNAGLITGRYNARKPETAGESYPVSRFSQTANWYAYSDIAPLMCFLDNCKHNTLVLNGVQAGQGLSFLPALTPGELSSIDQKVDDGRPATGNLVTYPSLSDCVMAANGGTATASMADSVYRLSHNAPACAAAFVRTY